MVDDPVVTGGLDQDDRRTHVDRINPGDDVGLWTGPRDDGRRPYRLTRMAKQADAILPPGTVVMLLPSEVESHHDQLWDDVEPVPVFADPREARIVELQNALREATVGRQAAEAQRDQIMAEARKALDGRDAAIAERDKAKADCASTEQYIADMQADLDATKAKLQEANSQNSELHDALDKATQPDAEPAPEKSSEDL